MEKKTLFAVLKWSAKVLVLLLVAVVSGIGFRYCLIQSNGNLHTVESGLVYRSAQLSEEEFTRQVKKLGIRSVINLRGENLGADWYEAEVKAAKSLGVAFINYRMSAQVVLTVEQMKELALVMKGAPKPLLIHCRAGADRTGLAAALYCLEEGMLPGFVQLQLSPCFGHFPFLYSESIAMDQSLVQYLRVKTSHPAAEEVGVSR
jgi:protein tyrosine phosphatase (PTP) superfamily phosphohydrolase (DUF442 family)